MDRSRLENFATRVRGVGRTEELDGAAAEVLDRFDEAGVASLLLKGAALAQLLYSSKQQRGYSDVDLLVAPDHLPAARRVLSELGYENTTAARGVEDIAGAVHAETWVRRSEVIGPLMIDLHARFPGVQVAPEDAWLLLAAERTSIEVGRRNASVLSRKGLAFHLATHAAQHGPDDPRPLVELRLALAEWPAPTWRGAAELAGRLAGEAAFAAGLRLVPEGAALAAELGLPATDTLDWEIRNRGERPRGTYHLQALAEARGLRERARVACRILLPTREWIAWENPRAARGRLSLLRAYATHMLRLPWWGVRVLLYRRRRSRGTASTTT